MCNQSENYGNFQVGPFLPRGPKTWASSHTSAHTHISQTTNLMFHLRLRLNLFHLISLGRLWFQPHWEKTDKLSWRGSKNVVICVTLTSLSTINTCNKSGEKLLGLCEITNRQKRYKRRKKFRWYLVIVPRSCWVGGKMRFVCSRLALSVMLCWCHVACCSLELAGSFKAAADYQFNDVVDSPWQTPTYQTQNEKLIKFFSNIFPIIDNLLIAISIRSSDPIRA